MKIIICLLLTCFVLSCTTDLRDLHEKEGAVPKTKRFVYTILYDSARDTAHDLWLILDTETGTEYLSRVGGGFIEVSK